MPLPARTPETEIDHAAEALDDLPAALRTPLIRAIVRAFAERVQALWDARGQILAAMDLTDPGRVRPFSLLAWGSILGVAWRKAWSAEQYRTVLLAAVVARRSDASREAVLAVVQALTPKGAPPPSVQASPLTVWVSAPGITDPAMQEALPALLFSAIPDVADLGLYFPGSENVLMFDTALHGFDGGKFA